MANSEFNRWNQAIYHKLEAEIEDSDDDESCHDRHLEVDSSFKLIDVIIVDAALLGFKEISSLMGVLEDNDHEDKIECVQ